jgi:copper homeostasis protein CutC
MMPSEARVAMLVPLALLQVLTSGLTRTAEEISATSGRYIDLVELRYERMPGQGSAVERVRQASVAVMDHYGSISD